MRLIVLISIWACGADSHQNAELHLEGPSMVRVDGLGMVQGPRVLLADGTTPTGMVVEVRPSGVAKAQGTDVIATGAGEATVSIRWRDSEVKWNLVVVPSEHLSLQDPPFEVGTGQRAELVVVNEQRRRVAGERLDWSSSAPDVATVEDGWVTGVSPGVVFVTAKGNGSQVMLELDVD